MDSQKHEEIVKMLNSTRIKEYSLKQLNTHNQEDDHWVAVHGYIYDVTEFKKRHPGGELVFKLGKEMT